MLSDDSLLFEFVTESKEHLSSIEPDLLTLESQGADAGAEIVNRVFRAIHSIKGASGFFGLEALKNLSHTMESVLMLVRDGKLTVSATVMDPLLAGVDKLNIMLEDIHNSEEVPYQEELAPLEVLLGKSPSVAPDGSSGTQVQPEAVQSVCGFSPDPIAVESSFSTRAAVLCIDSITRQRSRWKKIVIH